jgi:hypothetical protein
LHDSPYCCFSYQPTADQPADEPAMLMLKQHPKHEECVLTTTLTWISACLPHIISVGERLVLMLHAYTDWSNCGMWVLD